MSDVTFVATAISVVVAGQYEDLAVEGPFLDFIATRASAAQALSELTGWARRNEDRLLERNWLIQITQVNEFGDQIGTPEVFDVVKSVRLTPRIQE